MANILGLIPKLREGQIAKGVKGLWENAEASWKGGWQVRDEEGEVYDSLTDGMVADTDWELISPKTSTFNKIEELILDITADTCVDTCSCCERLYDLQDDLLTHFKALIHLLDNK